MRAQKAASLLASQEHALKSAGWKLRGVWGDRKAK